MHVLVTEALFGDADRLADQLGATGCRVSRCHDRSGLCRALAAGDRCPLDSADRADRVDLVVDVRSPMPDLTAREFGVVCAVRQRIPVVVVSADATRPTVPAGLEGRVAVVGARQLVEDCRDARGVGASR